MLTILTVWLSFCDLGKFSNYYMLKIGNAEGAVNLQADSQEYNHDGKQQASIMEHSQLGGERPPLSVVRNATNAEEKLVKGDIQEIQWPFQTAKEARLYFVHVGKCGGKSLYKSLHILSIFNTLECRMKKNDDENDDRCATTKFDSVISRRIFGHLHLFR